MSSKTTWKDILDEFKQRHPSLAKQVVDFRPHSFATIKIWFKDGKTMTYDSVTKQGRWGQDWKSD